MQKFHTFNIYLLKFIYLKVATVFKHNVHNKTDHNVRIIKKVIIFENTVMQVSCRHVFLCIKVH